MDKALKESKGNKEKGILILIMVLGIALLILTPISVVLFTDDEGNGVSYQDQDDLVSGDMSMDDSSKALWMDYLSSAPTLEINSRDLDPLVEQRELNRLTEIPEGINETDDNYNKDAGQTNGEGGREVDDDALDGDVEAPQSGDEREVEESDIVKVIDDRMFILNTYLGFVVIDLEDPARPVMEARLMLQGRPVSMYVVDFLGFVIVSDVPTEDQGSQWNTGRLYIIDLTAPSDPRVVKYIDIEGYPMDSRRVGEVIYVISNEQPDYYGGWDWRFIEGDIALDSGSTDEETSKTNVISIGFYDPEELGLVDEVAIEGNSGKIHASQTAIFAPQEVGDWDRPRTKFQYIDISDPEGDIKIRGTIEVDGYLRDRFQMDHYMGMFRVVTQEHPSRQMEDRFPSSTLRVIDARDPDDMYELSSLLIDDEGNLMATRFAGDRAYTIHLPETIDPLDVIDLSDPTDPKLTDILEIPGWVEHLEVIGKKIIAVGVDNEDEMKVALYLFDVSDPENAVLSDRVVIGEGYTYSQANWDEKAMTVIPDMGLVSLPFTSYDWEKYTGQVNGIQLISFDLEEGELETRGTIEQTGQISRSRMVNGYLVATSENVLQSIDVSNLDEPVIAGALDLARNHVDVFISKDKLVSLVLPPYGESGARIEVSGISNPQKKTLSIGPDGLDFERFYREGNMVYVKGIRQGEGYPDPMIEVHLYDMEDPGEPVHYKVFSRKITASYDKTWYYDREILEDDTEEGGSWTLYYDPSTLTILDIGRIAVYDQYYGYYYMEGQSGDQERIWIVEWNAKDSYSTIKVSLSSEINIYGIYQGSGDNILLETYLYPEGYRLMEVEVSEGAVSQINEHILKGDVFGVSDDGTLVYTSLNYYVDNSYNSTLNIYDITGDSAELVDAIIIDEFDYTVALRNDVVVLITTDWGYYPRYPYVDYDMEMDDAAYSGSGEDGVKGEEMYVPSTRMHLIGIEEGLFKNDTLLEMEGSYYSRTILEDIVVISSGSDHIGIEIGASSDRRTYSWWSPGWVSGGDIEGDITVHAMGLYGIDVVYL